MGLALGRKSGKAVVEKGVVRQQMNAAEAAGASEAAGVLWSLRDLRVRLG
jgi:hypothetical protein